MTNVVDTHAPSSTSELQNRKVRQILDAARRLFLEEGYYPSSMDAIVEAAGVSKATLYAHFGSKEELLLALVKDEFHQTQTLWETASDPIDVEQVLWSIAMAFGTPMLKDPAFPALRMLVNHARRFPEMVEFYMDAGPRKHHAEVVAFLRVAYDQGLLVVPNFELAATQFLAMLAGDLPMKWALVGKPPSRAEYEVLARGAIRVFLAAYAGPIMTKKRSDCLLKE